MARGVRHVEASGSVPEYYTGYEMQGNEWENRVKAHLAELFNGELSGQFDASDAEGWTDALIARFAGSGDEEMLAAASATDVLEWLNDYDDCEHWGECVEQRVKYLNTKEQSS